MAANPQQVPSFPAPGANGPCGMSSKPATRATADVNEQATADYDMADRNDFDDADRGFVAPVPDRRTVNDAGRVVYDGSIFDFIAGHEPHPDTASPALWRQAQIMRRAATTGTSSYDSVLAMPTDLLLDFAAVHVIGEKAAEVELRINITITETGEQWAMWIRNGVLNARPAHAPGADRRCPAARRRLRRCC